MKAHRITIIIPCFNEEETLPVYYQAMLPVMKQMNPVDFELLFIDDGSSDHTLLEMKQLHQKDPRCKYLSFSRNFGKEAAIYAGLSKASGDYVAVMDVDLQDPPSLLPEMYKILIEEEYDSVATRRSDRTGEPKIRSFLSDSFYKIINRISKTEIMRGARDFRLMKRNMVDAVLEMSEYNRFSKGIFEWVGFRTKWLEYENIERSAGETKWSLKKLFVYSMEGITGFSVAPLSLASVLGLLFCLISFVMIMQAYDFYALYQKYGCNLQFGGDDQWSNMLAGTELIRRKLGEDASAMTITLLLNSEGKKMGKTQSGAVWLDPNKTSPFDFYQYWRNVADADVLKCIRMLTFLPLEEIDKMDSWEGAQLNTAKEILAFELTKLVHGEEEANKAQESARALFSQGNAAQMPTAELTEEDFEGNEIDILTLLLKSGLVPSKSEARRAVQQGGVAADGEKVADIHAVFTKDALSGEGIVLKKGKKNFRKVVVK